MTLRPHFRSPPHATSKHTTQTRSHIPGALSCRVLNVLSMNESVGANLEARLLCCLFFLVSLHGQHNLLLLSATAWESAEIGSTITHSFCTSSSFSEFLSVLSCRGVGVERFISDCCGGIIMPGIHVSWKRRRMHARLSHSDSQGKKAKN